MENATLTLLRDGISPLFAVLLALLAFVLLTIAFALGALFQRLKDLRSLKGQRRDAVKKSRSSLTGQMIEQVAPFLPGFPCNPADVRFVGKPIDFVGFPGAAEGKAIDEVLFIEVKSGKSKLSERERQIKTAVESARVRYVEWHV